jgi:hypothetical protein
VRYDLTEELSYLRAIKHKNRPGSSRSTERVAEIAFNYCQQPFGGWQGKSIDGQNILHHIRPIRFIQIIHHAIAASVLTTIEIKFMHDIKISTQSLVRRGKINVGLVLGQIIDNHLS